MPRLRHDTRLARFCGTCESTTPGSSAVNQAVVYASRGDPARGAR